ncbi:MAG: hypothetical protein AAGG68_27520 [Bacteroidota bacterium]
MRFFRKKRQKEISQHRFSRYVLYAVGEIFIVGVGVYLAVLLNNWNNNTNTQADIHKYALRLDKEIDREKEMVQYNFDYLKDSTINMLITARRIVINETEDSLHLIEDVLNETVYPVEIISEMPVLNEFIDKGYLSFIDDEEMNKLFWYHNIFRSQAKKNEERLENFQQLHMHPLLMDKISYGKYISFSGYQLNHRGDRSDLKNLLEDQSFENMITLLILHYEDDVRIYENYIKVLDEIQKRMKEIVLQP